MATLITTNVNGTLTTTGTITSGGAFVLPGGFTMDHPGSGYAQFSNWVLLSGTSGFYASANGAHIYPNNGSYGSWRMDGSRNGWQGIEFGSGSNGAVSLMVSTDSNTSGFHNNSYGWQFRWSNGTAYVNKSSYGAGTDATVLDSSNAAYAWNMNQYVRTSDSVSFQDVTVNGGLKVVGVFKDSTGSAGTSGQVLSSTVTGTAWIAPPSGGTSGSGTTNYVSKWTGSTSLGNSNIVDDGFNVSISYSNTFPLRLVRTGGPVCRISFEDPDNMSNDAVWVGSEGFALCLGSSYSEQARISSNGNLLVGTTTDSGYKLDVNGTIRATGDVIAYSDARVKENIETISNALDKVRAMRGVNYNKIGETKRSVGVIAQELLEIVPEAVQQDYQGMYSVAYGNLVGILIEAMKEQQSQIEELKAEIQKLKSN